MIPRWVWLFTLFLPLHLRAQEAQEPKLLGKAWTCHTPIEWTNTIKKITVGDIAILAGPVPESHDVECIPPYSLVADKAKKLLKLVYDPDPRGCVPGTLHGSGLAVSIASLTEGDWTLCCEELQFTNTFHVYPAGLPPTIETALIDGELEIRFQSSEDRTYFVDFSTDLKSWDRVKPMGSELYIQQIDPRCLETHSRVNGVR